MGALRRRSLLLAAGLLTQAVYLAVTLRLPWWRYGRSLNSWRELLGGGQGALAACLFGAGILFAAYVLGWRAVRGLAPRGGAFRRRTVWIFAIVFAATLLWLMPITSDLFNYLVQSHLFTDLGLNPLVEAATQPDGTALGGGQLEDPVLLAYPTAYAASPSIYGPAWTLLSAPGTAGRNDLVFGPLYLKGLAAAAFLASAWLVERILVRVRPAAALEGLYLFAWNPLVLLMAVGDGHNDVVMMALALVAFWFLLRESWMPAFGTLAFSAWIKYVSVVFLPLFVLYAFWLGRQGRHRGPGPSWLQGGLAVLAVSGLVYAPLGSVGWGLGVLERLLEPANWSATIDMQIALEIPPGWSGAGFAPMGAQSSLPKLLLAVGLLSFGAAYLFLSGRLVADLKRGGQVSGQPGGVPARHAHGRGRQDRAQRILDVGFMVSLLVFIMGAARSQPWHLLWPASLAGLSAQRWAWPAVLALSALMLASQLWVEWGTPGLGILY